MAPFSLEDLDDVRAWADPIRAAVEQGTMPPWKPRDLAPLRFDRSLRPEDRDLLLDWLDAGMPEGDPAGPVRAVPPLESIPPVRPDLVLEPEAPLTLSEAGDHYRCFPLGEPESEPQHFRSIELRPGNGAAVHHIAFYEVTTFDRQQILDRDAAEPGPGYTCHGSGPGGVFPLFLFGWTPGGTAVPSPEGAPYRISAGSQLVMEVHYSVPADQVGQTDLTSAVIERYDGTPDEVFLQVPITDNALLIPAGAVGFEAGGSVTTSALAAALELPEVRLHSVFPHMHTRGRAISFDTGGEPFFEIPEWDFHWQQTFYFRDPVLLPEDGHVHLRCVFDNGPDDQPIVDGQPAPVEDVTWGERTQDEMCVGTLGIVTDASVDVIAALMALYYPS
jgi:hypothetical protein